MVSNIPTLYSTWQPFKKMNLFVYFCIIISQNDFILTPAELQRVVDHIIQVCL